MSPAFLFKKLNKKAKRGGAEKYSHNILNIGRRVGVCGIYRDTRGRPEKVRRLRRNNVTVGGRENAIMNDTYETLVGFRELDFTDDKGNSVKGTQLHTTYSEDGVTGKACGKTFIRAGSMELPPLTVGMALDITYNRKGKVTSVKAATPAKS